MVFHCSLSQQRGPGAAGGYLRLLRAREGGGAEGGGRGEGEKGRGEGEGKGEGQEVWVLDGGFVKWAEMYGEDERLTEGFVRDVWM